MNKVLLVSGVSGNGGTQTWTKEYLKSYNNADFKLVHVNLSKRRGLNAEASVLRRIYEGLLDLYEVYFNVRKQLRKGDIKIMHAATSGSLGTLRDYLLGRLAQRHGIKTILHCHYGCIAADYSQKGFGFLLRKTFGKYNQIWVLDSKSKEVLSSDLRIKSRVNVVPNFIEIPESPNLDKRHYYKIAFIGNVVPTKGIFDLVTAVTNLSEDTVLYIVGPVDDDVKCRIKDIAGTEFDKRIKILGCLPNNQAVQFMKEIDILSLPTYYPSEAFPISILEAMSQGCLVLSCPRAAIPDMLALEDGTSCGLLVPPQSPAAIADSIKWCQNNCEEADKLRHKAYMKAKKCYSKTVVFRLYSYLYSQLL